MFRSVITRLHKQDSWTKVLHGIGSSISFSNHVSHKHHSDIRRVEDDKSRKNFHELFHDISEVLKLSLSLCLVPAVTVTDKYQSYTNFWFTFLCYETRSTLPGAPPFFIHFQLISLLSELIFRQSDPFSK